MSQRKPFFNSPKKVVTITLCTIAVLAIVVIGAGFGAYAVIRGRSISAEQAQASAYADAGIDPSAARMVHTELDFDHGQLVYEVEFTADGTEYEYQIKASDGTVINRELDIIAPKVSNQTNTETKTESDSTDSDIGMTEAKSIAARHAGLSSSDVRFSKAELDYEHGGMVYEIEFYANGMEYEYEIDAANGTVLKYDSERED